MAALHVTDAPEEQAAVGDFLGERRHDDRDHQQAEKIEWAIDGGHKAAGGAGDILLTEEQEDHLVQRDEDELGGDSERETRWDVDRAHPPSEIAPPTEAGTTGEERSTSEAKPQRCIDDGQPSSGHTVVVERGGLPDLADGTAEFAADTGRHRQLPARGGDDQTGENAGGKDATDEPDDRQDNPLCRRHGAQLANFNVTAAWAAERRSRSSQPFGGWVRSA